MQVKNTISQWPCCFMMTKSQDMVAPFSSPFCYQTDIRMTNWQVDVYLDKAVPSISVFSLLHDKRRGPPHCFSILPKICQKLPSELTGKEKVEMGWSCGKNGRWKTDRNQKPERGKKKEARKTENLKGWLTARYEKSGKTKIRMENSRKWEEVETVDRECRESKREKSGERKNQPHP